MDITLAGTGVGPIYSDDSSGSVDVGDIPGTATFSISNNGELGLGALTDLTINTVTVINNDGKVLFSTDLAPGTVIPAGSSHLVTVTGSFGLPGTGVSTGTLILGTDQGAALGGDGADFTIALNAFAFVPEPTSIVLTSLGALAILVIGVRRR